jgi:hypothetical protein
VATARIVRNDARKVDKTIQGQKLAQAGAAKHACRLRQVTAKNQEARSGDVINGKRGWNLRR